MQHEALAIVPCRKIKVNHPARHILYLPGGQLIIICSWDGSFRKWNLEKGTQVGEEWEDKDQGVEIITLSPGGKNVASWSSDGTVKFWNVDTGKVINTWTGHTNRVRSLSWSLDGGQVVSGSKDGTFRVWDVESGRTILGPINTGKDVDDVRAACYSPDAKMIATGGNWNGLTIWDANSGELLKTFKGVFSCLAWISDGKTLVAGGWKVMKIDTATWTVLDLCEHYTDTVLLSPNDRILATTLFKTAQLWDLETNQPIGSPLHHQEYVKSVAFSADGKFLVTSCIDDHIYTWDVSDIVKRAGFPSDIADVTSPKMNGARQIPPGFFDDALREANLRIRLSQSHAPHIPTPRQRTLSPFTSVWQRYRPHGAAESATQSRSQSFSWTRKLSGILHRRDRSDIQLQEVEVPCTAGKPRNYHATKKKPAASSSLPPNNHTTQQPSGAAQNTSSSRLPPSTTTASTLSDVTGTTGATGTVSRPHITGAGWRACFVAWICCMPIKNAEGCH
ncbi:WD40 repeat-like protein [Suillus brevipes Sb2]|nr:WD40 repeat-like protein [Suillus brevipes Sb2]